MLRPPRATGRRTWSPVLLGGAGALLLGISFGLTYLLVDPPAAPTVTAPPPGVPGPNTPFQLSNVTTGKCVVVQEGRVQQDVCAPADDPGRRWTLERTRSVSDVQLYWIRSAGGERSCLDLPRFGGVQEGTPFATFVCAAPAEADNQEFELRRVADDGAGVAQFAVVNHVTGLCLDVDGSATAGTDTATGRALGVSRCQSPVDGWDDRLWTLNVLASA